MYKVHGETVGRYKFLKKYRWEDDHDFGFEVNDRLAWRNFLIHDLELPHKSKDGAPLAYMVFKYGGNDRILNIFPGKSSDGDSLPLALYGRLDKMPPKKFQRIKSGDN